MALVAVADRLEPAGAGLLRHALGTARPAGGGHRDARGVAFALRRGRDLGAGLLADRPGPAHGRLRSTWGLSLRLQRPAFLAWMSAAVLMGIVLGSVADSVSGFVDTPAMAEFLERLGGRQGLVDAFLAAELGIIGSLVAAYGIAASHWLPAEEEGGRTEIVLATATSRRRWATSHAVLALVGVAVLMVLVGLAVGLGYALSVGEPDQVWRLGLAATARIPAAWVMVGLAVAIWGFWPRLTWLRVGVVRRVPGDGRVRGPLGHPGMAAQPQPVRPLAGGARPRPAVPGDPGDGGHRRGLVALGIGRFARRDVVSS